MKQEIYANLNKGGVSVREDGKVTGCYGEVVMQNVSFIVRKSGYEQTIREGQRNVHAFAKGEIIQKATIAPSIDSLNSLRASYPRIQYNPFRSDKFTCNGKPIDSAKSVIMVLTERKNERNKQLCEMFLVEA